MPKNVVYTAHAEDRIKMRNISKESIDKAFSAPDETIDQHEIKINHKVYGNKMLRVIYRESENSYIVITAYLTHKERYKVVNQNENNL